jgi:hypothetical protein
MHAAHKKAFAFDLPDAEITTVHLQAEAVAQSVPLSRIQRTAVIHLFQTDGTESSSVRREDGSTAKCICAKRLRQGTLEGARTHWGIDDDDASSASSNLGDGPNWAAHNS